MLSVFAGSVIFVDDVLFFFAKIELGTGSVKGTVRE